jgi:hypothetical protein
MSREKTAELKAAIERREAYLAERSEMEFSHGLCPECARVLYPENDTSES